MNLNLIGGGKSKSEEVKTKRKRSKTDEPEELELEEMVVGGGADEEEEQLDPPAQRGKLQGRDQGKKRRVETHGHKMVEKDMYKREKDRRKLTEKVGSKNWSR